MSYIGDLQFRSFCLTLNNCINNDLSQHQLAYIINTGVFFVKPEYSARCVTEQYLVKIT